MFSIFNGFLLKNKLLFFKWFNYTVFKTHKGMEKICLSIKLITLSQQTQ